MSILYRSVKSQKLNSPPYRFSLTNIANNYVWQIPIWKQPYQKYIPYNYIYISNNTDKNLTLAINNQEFKTIYSGTIETFDAQVYPAIRSINIINESGADATGEIEIIVQRKYTVSDLINNFIVGD